MMSDEISLEGPVELIDGKLTLQIPLAADGDKLALLARGIGDVDGENLNVVIQPWLAEKLRIGAGSLVLVDNRNGKFTITRSAKNDDPKRQRATRDQRISAQIVDPSLRPADPETASPLRRRVGVVLLVLGFTSILVAGFWLMLANWFLIAGSLLLVAGVSFFGRRFRGAEADHDIRKLYGAH